MELLGTLKRYLNIQDNSQDTFLQECINESLAYCQSYTGRWLLKYNYIEYVTRIYALKFARGKIFYTKYYPIISVNKVEYLEGDKWYEVDLSKIEFSQNKIIINDSSLTSEKHTYRLSYTAGYDDTLAPMPADLVNAIKKLSAEYYYDSAAGDNRQGITSRNWNSQGSEGTSFKSILQEINEILDNYKQVKI